MWDYEYFIPTMISLVVLAIKVTQVQPDISTRRAVLLTGILWILSSCVVLVFLVEGKMHLLWQDIDHCVGATLFVALPFLAVLGVDLVMRLANWAQPFRRVSAMFVAFVSWPFLPWLFFVGAIMGGGV